MKKRLTRRACAMIERSLAHFPELSDKKITVGYTLAHLGSAMIAYRGGRVTRLIIRLKVRKLSYQTIGHELTHLIQGLARGERGAPGALPRKIPCGEKQCDIWTLARDPLFCDEAPTYLRLPRIVRERWAEYAGGVRRLCIQAIAKRSTHRLYIRWLEAEVDKLVEIRPWKRTEGDQLMLPFASRDRAALIGQHAATN